MDSTRPHPGWRPLMSGLCYKLISSMNSCNSSCLVVGRSMLLYREIPHIIDTCNATLLSILKFEFEIVNSKVSRPVRLHSKCRVSLLWKPEVLSFTSTQFGDQQGLSNYQKQKGDPDLANLNLHLGLIFGINVQFRIRNHIQNWGLTEKCDSEFEFGSEFEFSADRVIHLSYLGVH